MNAGVVNDWRTLVKLAEEGVIDWDDVWIAYLGHDEAGRFNYDEGGEGG